MIFSVRMQSRLLGALLPAALLGLAVPLAGCSSIWEPWLQVRPVLGSDVVIPLILNSKMKPCSPTLRGIWGTAKVFWTVGDIKCIENTARILQWDGTMFNEENSNTNGMALESIWGSDVSDIWAVGGLSAAAAADGTRAEVNQGVILRRTYGSWSSVSVTPPGYHLKDVHGSSASNVWAVGEKGTIININPAAGSPAWEGTPPAYLTYNFSGVFVASENDVWVVGGTSTAKLELNALTASGPGIILHLSKGATTWTAAPVIDPTLQNNLFGIRGTSPDDIWAVGEKGTLLHCDGQSCLSQSVEANFPCPDSLCPDYFRIKGNAAGTALWTGNKSGDLFRKTAAGWSQDAPENRATIVDLWPDPSGDLWVTTFGGGIKHYVLQPDL